MYGRHFIYENLVIYWWHGSYINLPMTSRWLNDICKIPSRRLFHDTSVHAG